MAERKSELTAYGFSLSVLAYVNKERKNPEESLKCWIKSPLEGRAQDMLF